MAVNIPEVKEYEEKLNEAESRGEKLHSDCIVRPKITLSSCLENFGQTELVEQFYSTAIKDKTTARKTSRLASNPDFLFLHLKKFTLREDWVSIKLDVSVEVPDVLDIGSLRATGLLPNEELLPELDGETPPPAPMDPIVLQQLVDMGFPSEACKRAVFFTNNSGIEVATQWIMEHITDSDFGDPFTPPGLDSKNVKFTPDPNGLEMLMGMGFNAAQATKALKETSNNIERAADWIFSHQMEIDSLELGSTAETIEAPQILHRTGGSSKFFFLF